MKRLLLCMVLALVAVSAFAQKRECYVVKNDGSQIKAVDIKLRNPNGDLNVLVKQGSPALQLLKKDYAYAVVPKPAQVEQLEKSLAAKNYDQALKDAKAAFDAFKFLGWGDYAKSMECQAQIGKNDVKAARKALMGAKSSKGPNGDAVLKAEIFLLLAEKEYDKVDAALKKLMTSKDDATAALAFNMRGQVCQAKDQKKQAVLEYLKTLLLFEPDNKKVAAERAEAKRQAVALLKELKDPRAAKIEAMK